MNEPTMRATAEALGLTTAKTDDLTSVIAFLNSKGINTNPPAGPAPAGPAPAGSTPVGVVISQAVKDAIKKASDNIKDAQSAGTMNNLDASKMGMRPKFFDPSLSQYKEGMYLYFGDDCPVKEVPVGTQGNSAIVVTVAAGMTPDRLEKPFNVYVTTLRKTIRVTDADGEPHLDNNKNQVEVTGAGNAIWDACNACSDEGEVLNYMRGKRVKVSKILKEFGPSKFVDGVPTAHKLTSLPLLVEA